MSRTVLQRVQNPRNRSCGCAPGCWCKRTAVGRAVRWWFPGRYLGMPHTSPGSAGWKRDQHSLGQVPGLGER
jgi:hypothetical protein